MAKYRFYYILFAVVSTVLMFSYKSKLTSVLFLIAIAIPVISFVLLVFQDFLSKSESNTTRSQRKSLKIPIFR